MVITTRSLGRLASVSSQTVVVAPRVTPVSRDLNARRPKKVFSLASNICLIPQRCLVAVARNGGPGLSSLVPCLTPAQLPPSPVQHVVPAMDVMVNAGRTSGAVVSCVATGVSASLTSCGNSCSALREQLQASAALCETQRLQIDDLAAELQRLQLQVHASEEIRASAVPTPVLHTCKIVVHGFAQGASDKHAYTVLFTEFVQNTLRIRNVPSIKVQQLRPSCCTQSGLSFAVVLLQSVSDVERILAAAAQYLDSSSLIRIDGSRTKAARVARASAWALQQNPAAARCAWQARSAVAPLYQGPLNRTVQTSSGPLLNACAFSFVPGSEGHVLAGASRPSRAVAIVRPVATSAQLTTPTPTSTATSAPTSAPTTASTTATAPAPAHASTIATVTAPAHAPVTNALSSAPPDQE